MQVYKLLNMVKNTLAMGGGGGKKPNQSMLTVHNFITRPLQLTKQGKEPRIRLIQTSDPICCSPLLVRPHELVEEKLLFGAKQT